MSNRPKTAKIDVTKIDKQHLFHAKSGAVYLDLVLFPNDGRYEDDHVILQSISKEKREAGEKGVILGNATLNEPSDAGPNNDPGDNYREKAGQKALPSHEDVDTGEGQDVPF